MKNIAGRVNDDIYRREVMISNSATRFKVGGDAILDIVIKNHIRLMIGWIERPPLRMNILRELADE